MPEFKFAEDTHTYTLDGVVLPSITTVLPYSSYGDNTEAMERGKAVHRACYLANIGKSDIEIMTDTELAIWFQNDNFENYLWAYRDFLDSGSIEGCIDIKSGSPHPTTPLQLAAQNLLVKEAILEIKIPIFETPLYHQTYKFAGTPDIVTNVDRVYALYLKDNGKFKLEDHTKDLRKNTQIFLSFLTCHRWQKEHNL